METPTEPLLGRSWFINGTNAAFTGTGTWQASGVEDRRESSSVISRVISTFLYIAFPALGSPTCPNTSRGQWLGKKMQHIFLRKKPNPDAKQREGGSYGCNLAK